MHCEPDANFCRKSSVTTPKSPLLPSIRRGDVASSDRRVDEESLVERAEEAREAARIAQLIRTKRTRIDCRKPVTKQIRIRDRTPAL
jgi:hypothetical protein